MYAAQIKWDVSLLSVESSFLSDFGFSALNRCMIMVYGEAKQHLLENHGLALIQRNANQHSVYDSAFAFSMHIYFKICSLEQRSVPESWD